MIDKVEQEIIMAEFGELLRKKREEKGITQKTLGDAVFVTRQAVSQWENGTRYPDLLTAKKLADYFDCTIDGLLGEDRMSSYADVMQVAEEPSDDKLQLLVYGILLALSLIALSVTASYLYMEYGAMELPFRDTLLIPYCLLQTLSCIFCVIMCRTKNMRPSVIGITVCMMNILCVIEPGVSWKLSKEYFLLFLQFLKPVLAIPTVIFFLRKNITNRIHAVISCLAVIGVNLMELLTAVLTIISVEFTFTEMNRVFSYIYMIILMSLTIWQIDLLTRKRNRAKGGG